MRKLAYCIANLLMKIFHKNHAFRYICYYYLQIGLSHFFTLLTVLFLGVIFDIYYAYLIVLPVFYITKLLTKLDYHATSFISCGFMSCTMLAILGSITQYIDIKLGICSTILLVLLMSTGKFDNDLDKFSKWVDKMVKYVAK